MERTNNRVLLIEDDRIAQLMFERFVSQEALAYDCTIAGSVAEAQNILSRKQFDIIVSDYSLGDGTALDILNSVKNIPVILTTGAADERVAIKAWRAGAYDYLPKDMDANYIKAIPKAIENAIKRKQVEDALDRKQKDLEAIFNAAPVGMLLVDAEMTVTRANNTFRQMLHREYKDIIGRKIGDAMGCINNSADNGCGCGPVCDDCLLRNIVINVFNLGRSTHEFEIHPTLEFDNKKTSFWFHISAEPLTVDADKYAIIAINDITERIKAEDERRLAEEKYRLIFENSAVGISMVDEQERLISWNKFMEQLLGMSRSDLYLQPVRLLYPADEWQKIRANNVRRKGMQHHLETRMLRKDGSIIEVDVSLSVIRDSDGRRTGSIGVIRDITERKRADAELRETMELKSQFISTVSHELRTPLTAIKEALGIVLDGVVGRVNEKQKKFLNIVHRNVNRLNELINDVLDFQKLKAGKMELDIRSHDIKQVLSEVSETMTLEAEKNQVDLSFDLAENISRAEFDRSKIVQVLTNLVSNGIKFTHPEGKVSVMIERRGEDWVIDVSDTGVGIPKESLFKIFNRFYRVSRPGEQIQGTGLGLAIVREIVTMHGGRIDVESKEGHGSSFAVILPLNMKSPLQASPAAVDEYLESNIV